MSTYVENSANHADDLFFVGEVKYFGNVLDHVKFEVLEQGHREFVVA